MSIREPLKRMNAGISIELNHIGQEVTVSNTATLRRMKNVSKAMPDGVVDGAAQGLLVGVLER